MAYGAGHTLSEALEKEDELQTKAGASQDHTIAVEAFLAKQPPKYLGR
jgi:2-(1,2-epoxy-1,2-dihydrophenyl)acetyl-CoA isomerase